MKKCQYIRTARVQETQALEAGALYCYMETTAKSCQEANVTRQQQDGAYGRYKCIGGIKG